MELYKVADQGHWFTQKQINLFHQKLSELTKNENIAQEAGRYAAMPEASGVMRQWILGMVDPATAYEMIGKYSTNFTRSTRFKTKKIAPNNYLYSAFTRLCGHCFAVVACNREHRKVGVEV
jgi:hypothetical protein